MSNDNTPDKYNEKFSEEIKKLENIEKNKSICPYCNRETEFVWVHGHYQCPLCNNVVIGCCGDV